MNDGCENETSGEPPAGEYAFPVSFAQQRLWFLNQLEPASPTYNVSVALRLTGVLNVVALERSLGDLVRRHETLRTTFSLRQEEPLQVVHPAGDFSLSITDLRQMAEPDREATVKDLVYEQSTRPFRLDRGPLLRAGLIQTRHDESIFLLSMHHIVSDGWSMGVLFRELSILYRAHCAGAPSNLPELPIQYADFAIWQREWLQGENLEKQLSYWRKQLDGLATLQLPTDRLRPAVQSYRGSSREWSLSTGLTDGLKTISRREGATLYMILLAAFQLLLSRYSNQSDVAVGTPIAGRNRKETEGLIGFFVNTLVLRADLSRNPTFTELLRQVRETTLEAYNHQDLPFEKLVEELHPERSLNLSPLFQVMFVFQNTAEHPLDLEPVAASPIARNHAIAKFDLTLTMSERNGGLRGSLNYNRDLFDDSTIQRMQGHIQTLLEGIVADPNRPVNELPLLTSAERQQLLVEWNDTKSNFSKDRCIHGLFEAQVERTPDAVALEFAEQRLTYRALNQRANQLAHHLRNRGVGAETLVGICFERSIEMVVGLLGILKAGGAYVPLDPTYPDDRLKLILSDSHAGIIVTDSVCLGRLPSNNAQIICLDRDWQVIAGELQVNPCNQNSADHLAYVIYTSGSTGVPKGVAVPHRGVVRLLFGVDYAQLDAAQTIFHMAPISFDAATFELWGALLHGARCVLFPGKMADPRELGVSLKKHRVSTLWLTAALFNTVINEEPEALSEIKQLLIGGEALSVPHVKKALDLLPKTQIVNGYGPTESTTFACCYKIPHELDDRASSIPIGKPIANTQVYILDQQLNPVPIGVPGELHIGGDGLARGYLNRTELTAEKFVGNPFSSETSSRLYKTGDLGRYLADGNIEFLGRIDEQVKIRGYRIELGEIEAVLGQYPAVQNSAVVLREDARGDKQLVAYLVARHQGELEPGNVRQYLKLKLPEYMIPSKVVLLDELPLTPNGKVDRRALPVPDQSRLDGEKSYLAPRTPTEVALAGIWADVLKVDRIGVRDNFFDLGGHSLLAVRLSNSIQRQFQIPIRVAHLFEAPTVEQMALLMDAPRESNRSFLVALNSRGSKTPFFWIHGEDSDAYLPRYLGTDRPLYGLRHQSEDGQPARYRTVEDIATHYLEELQSVQQQGPYYLGGYCFGALVAFEMALRLQARGQRVDLLAFLNPATGRRLDPLHRSPQSQVRSWQELLSRHRSVLMSLELPDRWTYVAQRTKTKAEELLFNAVAPVKKVARKIAWEGYMALGLPIPVSLRSPYILDIYRKAMRRYTPQSYAGNLVLFCDADYPARSRLRWSMLNKAPTQICEVPGDHVSVLQEPYVGCWAKKIKTILDGTQSG